MNIIFFGNADFGIPTLDRLNQSSHNICSIVTNPDQRRSSRGKSKSTPIRKWASNNNITAIEIDNLQDANFLSRLELIKPDIFVVIAYKIIPEELYSIPKYGSMNLHASILPKYRGAAPIQRALLNGDNKTGVSTFIINNGIDKGEIVSQVSMDINIDDNFSSLHDKLSKLGAGIVIESLNKLSVGEKLIKQSGTSIYAKKITKDELCISWNSPSFEIHNKIRAFSPLPGAFTLINKNRVKILSSSYFENLNLNINPGHIVYTDNNMFVGTVDNPLQINLLKVEGKSEMSATDFYNGYISKQEIAKKFD